MRFVAWTDTSHVHKVRTTTTPHPSPVTPQPSPLTLHPPPPPSPLPHTHTHHPHPHPRHPTHTHTLPHTTTTGNGGGKRWDVAPGHPSDDCCSRVKRVRLTRKTRPGASSCVIPDPGHLTPRRWKRLRSPSSEGVGVEVGVPRNIFPRLGGWVRFCTRGSLEPATGGKGIGVRLVSALALPI